ncbi:MAG TPA: hydrolase 1, exosortase A system-associated [Burkholderiaceae bacterium]|nr:hydrolase 1, exosortase A system-associated [Burkholderiaceae bacterium]
MSADPLVTQSAAFVPARGGQRLRLVSDPVGAARGTVVLVHAFAEEMNKSRRMAARMARMLAADGWRVVQRDLQGCGDSTGEFVEATWDGWVEDVREEIAQALPGRPVWLWGIRCGALLCAQALGSHRHVNLLLWQPVLSGAQHLQQFLRLHAGARIVGSAKAQDARSPAQALREGEPVEVGGYELHPALASGLERSLFELPEGFQGRTVLFELSSDEAVELSPRLSQLADRLHERGLDVQATCLRGPAFWQTQEIEECEALLEASRAALRGEARAPASQAVPEAAAQGLASGEEVLRISCEGTQLLGIVSRPALPAQASSIAVLIVVGGPQYRVGSHRQFVLLARALARGGHTALRFDCRGMGDSEGAMRSFEDIGPDLRAALDALCREAATERVVVWGLCDAASAALMFASDDPRVVGIVAANPWARSDATLAAVRVRHYYASRLVQREFWAKLLRGGLNWRDSMASLAGTVRQARAARAGAESFHARMARGLARLRAPVLLILSGRDLTASEFLHHAQSDELWRRLLADPKITRHELPEADHTFSQRKWLDEANAATMAWLDRLAGSEPASTQHSTRQKERA